MQVALDGAETEKAQLVQRLKTLEDQFRHDKQQFEVRVCTCTIFLYLFQC